MADFGGASMAQPNKKKIAAKTANQRQAGAVEQARRNQGLGVELLRAREEDRKKRGEGTL